MAIRLDQKEGGIADFLLPLLLPPPPAATATNDEDEAEEVEAAEDWIDLAKGVKDCVPSGLVTKLAESHFGARNRSQA